MLQIIEQLKDKIQRYRSKDTEDTTQCPSCKIALAFTIPKKGYTSLAGRCPICGAGYVGLSNYGLVTLFTYQQAAKTGDAIAEMVSRNWDNFSQHEKEALAERIKNQRNEKEDRDYYVDDILSTWRHRKRDRV